MVEYWSWGGAFVTMALLFFLLARIALRAIQKAQEMSQAQRANDCSQEAVTI
jgi:uncharacterized protein YpmS